MRGTNISITVDFLKSRHFMKKPARVRRLSGKGNKLYCCIALRRSRHPLRRRFESHFVRQLSHSRPVEQKAAAARERSGEKVQCIEDRLSPRSCFYVQLLCNILLILEKNLPFLSTANYWLQSPTFASVVPPCCCVLFVFIFSNFTLPPRFLLYLHLCFTPSLSCCLSVMWSRTDAGSPNCGAEISALVARQLVRVATWRPPPPNSNPPPPK